MRLTVARRQWFRLDTHPPARWRWNPHPSPWSRFDSATGRFRVRYAADSPRAAMRERFDATGRALTGSHLDLRVVVLTGSVRILDLRLDRNLDALGIDDQVSTSRTPGVWAVGQTLADRVTNWYGPRCHGIVYRARTTPQRSANLAFFAHAPLAARSLGPLRTQTGLLTACVHSDGFVIEDW